MQGRAGGGEGAARVATRDERGAGNATEVREGARGAGGWRLEAEPLWSVKDAARFLNVSEKTVRRMEARGLLRRCSHVLGVVRFRQRDVRGLASA